MPYIAKNSFVADCQRLADARGYEQVIVVGIHANGTFRVSSFGQTRELCADAKRTADRIYGLMMGPVQTHVGLSSGRLIDDLERNG